jgi:HK97 family phage prohead protease
MIEETRAYQSRFELRDAGTSGRGPYRFLEGLAVPYETWADVYDWMAERHRQDSFKRSTNGGGGKQLPLLLFHDNRSWPIGHAERWSHDAEGMHGVWKLNGTEDAQTAAALAENGDLTGLSIGFQDAVEPEIDQDKAGKLWVTRLESRLVEVSVTPTPAFEAAGITMVRTAIQRPAPTELEVDRWRRRVVELAERAR